VNTKDLIAKLNDKGEDTHFYTDHNTTSLQLHAGPRYNNYLIAPVYHEDENDLRFILNIVESETNTTVQIVAQDTDDYAILNSPATEDRYPTGKTVWL